MIVMKSNKEFIDSIYLKYENALEADKKEFERKSAVRRRTIRYVTALAACLILAVGIYGADRLGYISTNLFGDDTIVEPGNDPGTVVGNGNGGSTEPGGATDPGELTDHENEQDGTEIGENETPEGAPEAIDDNGTPQASPDQEGGSDEGDGAPLGGIAAILAALGAGVFGFSRKRRNK